MKQYAYLVRLEHQQAQEVPFVLFSRDLLFHLSDRLLQISLAIQDYPVNLSVLLVLPLPLVLASLAHQVRPFRL